MHIGISIGISEAQAYKFSGCSRIASLQHINRLIPYGAPIYVRDDKIVSDMPKDVNRYLKCALRPCQVTEVTREFTSTLDIRLLKCTRCPVPLVTFTDARFLYYKLKVQVQIFTFGRYIQIKFPANLSEIYYNCKYMAQI